MRVMTLSTDLASDLRRGLALVLEQKRGKEEAETCTEAPLTEPRALPISPVKSPQRKHAKSLARHRKPESRAATPSERTHRSRSSYLCANRIRRGISARRSPWSSPDVCCGATADWGGSEDAVGSVEARRA